MMKQRQALLILCAWFSGTAAMQCENVGDVEQVNAVEAQRQAFNHAIADRNINGVRAVLHENVLLISGTDSDVYQGREAQLGIWTSTFADASAARYLRTSACVRVSPRFPIALEFGQWRGEAPDGSFAAGHYSAKWRLVDSQWLLESEIFATEDCGGRFCPDQ